MLVVVCVCATYVLYYIHICMHTGVRLYTTYIYYIPLHTCILYICIRIVLFSCNVYIMYTIYMYRPGGQEVLRQLPYPEGGGAVHTGRQAAHWRR